MGGVAAATIHDTGTRSRIQSDQQKAALRSIFETKDGASGHRPRQLIYQCTA
jgi:hypothetical protein